MLESKVSGLETVIIALYPQPQLAVCLPVHFKIAFQESDATPRIWFSFESLNEQLLSKSRNLKESAKGLERRVLEQEDLAGGIGRIKLNH